MSKLLLKIVIRIGVRFYVAVAAAPIPAAAAVITAAADVGRPSVVHGWR